MADDDNLPEDDPALSTLEFIAEARRPLLIERHRELVEEMESSLSDAFISGTADNPRLQSILRELDTESERARTLKTVQTLGDDAHYRSLPLREALVQELCLLRERGAVEIATLQSHVIGVYRTVQISLIKRQGAPAPLSDLRSMSTEMLARLLNPLQPVFGSPRLTDALVYTPAVADRTLAAAKRLRRAAAGDDHWQEAAGDPSLPREIEEPLEKLPETERRVARGMALQHAVRGAFYRNVFLHYLNPDELDPREIEAYPTVLSWLEGIEDTPHLFPFMQGQTSEQKLYRLSQLLQKLVQIHEMYARRERASESAELHAQFADKRIREQLQIMAKAHYPPLPLSNDMMVAVLLCPFAALVEWVQGLVASHDFVIPPDPKR
jgi:hypothetical protein